MVVRVDGLGPIPTSPITTNSFSCIARVKLSGIFRTISTSAIINYYIPPQFSIILTYIYPPIVIIITDITLLFFVGLLIYTARRNLEKSKIYRSHLSYGSNSGWYETYIQLSFQHQLLFPDLQRGRVAGILWPISASTNINNMIPSAIKRGRVSNIKIPMSMTSGIT